MRWLQLRAWAVGSEACPAAGTAENMKKELLRKLFRSSSFSMADGEKAGRAWLFGEKQEPHQSTGP